MVWEVIGGYSGAEFLVARQCYADRVMAGLSGAAWGESVFGGLMGVTKNSSVS